MSWRPPRRSASGTQVPSPGPQVVRAPVHDRIGRSVRNVEIGILSGVAESASGLCVRGQSQGVRSPFTDESGAWGARPGRTRLGLVQSPRLGGGQG